MTRNWVIAPYHFDRPEAFEQVWNFDRNNGVIAIGWNMGDLSDLSPEDIQNRHAEIWQDRSRVGLNQVLKFWREIQPGDRIIARGGRKKIVGIGTATGPAFYDPRKGAERIGRLVIEPYENFLPVRWESEEIEFPDMVFGMLTVYELPNDRFEKLTAGAVYQDEVERSHDYFLEQDDGDNQAEFVLERYLEEFIVSNFEAVFRSQLFLFVGEDNRTGQQYPTDVGVIDILAKDVSSNTYVVIELKKGKSSDVVIGQTLRYMGWVREHLSSADDPVRGLIICSGADEKLDYALSMIPNIDVKFYKVNFQLTDTPPK